MSHLDVRREANTQPSQRILQIALTHIDRADYNVAIQLLQGLVTRDSNFAKAYEWLGYCNKHLGNLEQALMFYQKFSEIEPCESSLFYLAETYYALGQDQYALSFYKEALGYIDYDSPFLFQIYKNLGNIYVKNSDYESAEEYYDKAYTINSHSDDLFVNYGTLELQKDRYDLALERFQAALNLNFFNDKAWVGLALIFRARGDFSLAWGDLLKAIDINMYNQVALKLCIDWALQDMNYEPAKEVLERFLKNYPNHVEWQYTYAGILFQLGRWEDSFREAHKVLSLDPNHQPSHELIRTLSSKLEN